MLEPIFDESSEGQSHHVVASFTLAEVREAATLATNSLRVPVIELTPYRESVKAVRLTDIGGITETESGYTFIGCAKQLVVQTKHVHELEATVAMSFRTTWCTVTVTGELGTMRTATFTSEAEVTGSFPQDLPRFLKGM